MRRLILALMSVVSILLTACSSQPVDLTNKLEKYAVPVNQLTVPDGVQIIGLGEATHNNGEFQSVRLDVFKVLVEKYGVRTFVLEEDFAITLAVQFKRALVNQDRVDFDAPVELIHNTTYVPLRFVSQTMGADVKWDQKTKEATVILDGKQVVVKLMKPKYQVPTNQRLSDTRIARLSEKLNEASDLSKVKQVRTYFKPYFTDRLIQQIIEQEGLHFKEMNFDMNTATVNYASNTSAMLIQSYIPGNILTGELHYVFDREAHIIYANGAWKVDKVSDHLRQIPNMSLEPDLQ